MRLNPVKLGLSGGIIGGVFLALFTLIAMYSGFAMMWLSQLTDLYPGYDLSIIGVIAGLIYGFIHGFVYFFLLAWLYNALKP